MSTILSQFPPLLQLRLTSSLSFCFLFSSPEFSSVLILDKVENNRARLDGSDKPVWGAIMSLGDNTVRGVDVNTNTFCASGGTLGNGSWAGESSYNLNQTTPKPSTHLYLSLATPQSLEETRPLPSEEQQQLLKPIWQVHIKMPMEGKPSDY